MAENEGQSVIGLTDQQLVYLSKQLVQAGKDSATYEQTGLQVPEGVEPWRALPMWGTLGQAHDLIQNYMRRQSSSDDKFTHDEAHDLWFDDPVWGRIKGYGSDTWCWMDAFYLAPIPWAMAEKFYFAGSGAAEDMDKGTDALAGNVAGILALGERGLLDSQIKDKAEERRRTRAKHLGDAYYVAGRPDKAFEMYEKAGDEEGMVRAIAALEGGVSTPYEMRYFGAHKELLGSVEVPRDYTGPALPFWGSGAGAGSGAPQAGAGSGNAQAVIEQQAADEFDPAALLQELGGYDSRIGALERDVGVAKAAADQMAHAHNRVRGQWRNT